MGAGIVVVGLARHGKDTVCEILRDSYGLSFESSSRILLEEVVYPALASKYGYFSEAECYADRVNHRQEWFELLKAYNVEDKAKLGKLIFSKYDVYCGLRNRDELDALVAAGLVNHIIWVDAEDRLGITEFCDSITITEDDANHVLDNTQSLADLRFEIDMLMEELGYEPN